MQVSLDAVELVHANGHRALAGVSIELAAGERVAVIGPSGAGKTTLVRLLGTSLPPTSGRALLGGSDPWRLSAKALRSLRSRIGVVHQNPPIPPRLRVVNAVLAGRLGTWPAWRSLVSLLSPRDAEGAYAALEQLGLGDRLFDRCDRVSGGQLQRVGIARVLYQQPSLVLADEPVSALDPTLADQAIGVLVEMGEKTGATLVASLHAVDLAMKWFPRIIGMRAGAVAFDCAASEIDEATLRDLYATEGPVLPMQGVTRDGTASPASIAPAAAARPSRCS